MVSTIYGSWTRPILPGEVNPIGLDGVWPQLLVGTWPDASNVGVWFPLSGGGSLKPCQTIRPNGTVNGITRWSRQQGLAGFRTGIFSDGTFSFSGRWWYRTVEVMSRNWEDFGVVRMVSPQRGLALMEIRTGSFSGGTTLLIFSITTGGGSDRQEGTDLSCRNIG